MNRLLLALLTTSVASAAMAQQLPCWNTNFGTNLGLFDDQMSVAQPLGFTFTYGGVAYTDIQVSDNGYITLGATGGVSNFSANALALVSDLFPRICPFWSDLDPSATGSGNVWFNAVPAAGGTPAHAIVTWLDVYQWGGSQSHTFQIVLIDGDTIRCSYDANLALPQPPWVVGASPGNGATQNPVTFPVGPTPLLTNGNPTFHEEDPVGLGSPLAGTTLDWIPDGQGGYIITPIINCAQANGYGTGCVARYSSFYEYFLPSTAMDLSNTSLQMMPTGPGYLVLAGGSGAYVAPSATATNLNLDDENYAHITFTGTFNYPGGSTTSFDVASNGVVSVASGYIGWEFTPNDFLNLSSPAWAVWHDFYPTTNSLDNVWWEELNGIVYITWWDVVGYLGTNIGTVTSRFQLQFDTNTDIVTFAFENMDNISINTWSGSSDGYVVGYTPGAGALDPGSTDLNGPNMPIVLEGADLAPITLAPSAPPVAGSTINLDVTNLTTTAAFGGLLIGLTKYDPGLSLTSIGMDGCFQYNEMAAVLLFFPSGSTTASVPLTMPNMLGLSLQVQAASYDPASPLTVLGGFSSSGWELIIGL